MREPGSPVLACCATLLVLAGCAADPPTDDDTSGYPCAGYESLATADELASTPRADHELELLALCMSQQFVAPQVVYDRVVADVTAIRAMDERVSHVTTRLGYDGRTLWLHADDAAAFEAIQDGSYASWQCLHEAYELVDIDPDDSCCSAFVTLEGIYDTHRLHDEYEALNGIASAGNYDMLWDGIDGPMIRGAIDGVTHHYIFRAAWDDCPAGCIQGTEYYFRTDAAGEASLVDSFTWNANEGGPSYPDWHYDYSCD